MKNKKKEVPMPAEIRARLAEFSQRAIENASLAGLCGIDDRFPDIIEPQLRGVAWELHGKPAVTPEALERREAELRQRGDAASLRAAAFFESLKDATLAAAPSRPVFAWRGCLIVLLAAALVGLAIPGLAWRGVAVVVLSAALAVLALPLVPAGVLFLLGSIRGLATCLRDLAASAVAYRGSRGLRRRAWAAADHQATVDHWVATQLRHLVAEYEYHKGLAASAKLAL